MKIPATYYLYFWFINSIAALGTGVIMGLVAWRIVSFIVLQSFIIPLYVLLGVPVLFLLAYQFFVLSFFWGKRRGTFEYAFLDKAARGRRPLTDLGARLKEITEELQYADPSSAHSKLKEALIDYPDNFIVQLNYALSCERIGQSEDAILAYQRALALIPESSEALNTYVTNQINRIKLKGPSESSSTPGLRYIIY